MKKRECVFWIAAALLSGWLCGKLAYCGDQIGYAIQYQGYSAPQKIVWYLVIPEGLGVLVCVLAALWYRKKTDPAQRLDVSLKSCHTWFGIAGLLLMQVMCAVVGHQYSRMQYPLDSAPRWVAFLYCLPYGVGILLCSTLAVVFYRRKQRKKQ